MDFGNRLKMKTSINSLKYHEQANFNLRHSKKLRSKIFKMLTESNQSLAFQLQYRIRRPFPLKNLQSHRIFKPRVVLVVWIKLTLTRSLILRTSLVNYLITWSAKININRITQIRMKIITLSPITSSMICLSKLKPQKWLKMTMILECHRYFDGLTTYIWISSFQVEWLTANTLTIKSTWGTCNSGTFQTTSNE